MNDDKTTREIKRLLYENGFVLVRANGHLVFENPQGLHHVMPATGSDVRGMRNSLCVLRHTLAGISHKREKQAHMTDAEAKQLFRKHARAC